ncbi:MAG: universal stress protein [Cyclobacteriaceae bacterium]
MKIVVPTDFSITSFNALSLAKSIAKKSDGEVILIHVIEAPSVSFSSMGEILNDGLEGVFMAELVKKTDDELQTLKKAHDDVPIKIVRKIGNPYKEIKDVVLWEKASLIIMGERGLGNHDDHFIGSLTDKFVRSSRVPVLTVNQSIGENPISNIVYATDLSEEHPELIYLLKRFQEVFDAKLHVVKINTRNKYANDVDTMVDLRMLVDKYDIENYSLEIYNHEDEEYGIIYYSDSVDADLIALGVHRKTGIRRLIHGGDLAEDVAGHTNRPVLTYHFDGRRITGS